MKGLILLVALALPTMGAALTEKEQQGRYAVCAAVFAIVAEEMEGEVKNDLMRQAQSYYKSVKEKRVIQPTIAHFQTQYANEYLSWDNLIAIAKDCERKY